MITFTFDSYRIPFIPSQNYVVWLQTQKYNKTYLKDYTNHYIWVKLERSGIKIGTGNAKKVLITT